MIGALGTDGVERGNKKRRMYSIAQAQIGKQMNQLLWKGKCMS
jgi:hypothetical protein